jgi:uncharacterized protein (TIGR00369 family)
VDDATETRVRRSFERQPFMSLLGARVRGLADGVVTLELPVREELGQQHGFVHAGVVTTLLDNACGFAGLAAMDADSGVLTSNFTVNLLRPAVGEVLVAEGRVAQAGRTLVVCQARAWAETGGIPGHDVALMTATLAAVRGRPDVVD